MKEQDNSDEKMGETNEGESFVDLSLDRRYLYQSPATGTSSATSLALKQLCRMFSPPASSTARFSAETQVLALLPDDSTYDPEGWKKARDVPVLRHAACNSFYYTQNQTSQGPVSCRQLATLRFQSEYPLDPEKDQVYGESTGNTWVLLKSLPDLEIALQAFRDQPALATETADASAATTISNPQDYDVSVMIYQDDDKPPPTDEPSDQKDDKEVQDELEAFLSSTDHLGPKGMHGSSNGNDDDDEDDDEAYESDGGTKYVKDPRTGNWIHHSLAPPKPSKANPSQPPPNKKAKTQHENNNSSNKSGTEKQKKKSKKAKFAAKNAKNWIYITGLPPDTTEEELAKFFAKVGIIDLDPETQRPKIKLYRHKDGDQAGTCKGDASLCYARPESVELALQVLDEAPFRDVVSTDDNTASCYRLSVGRAKFEQHGNYTERKRISQAQRKVAKLAVKQAMDWDDGEINGRLTGGLKGLRIIVLKGLFHPKEFGNEKEEDALLAELEKKVRTTSEEYGPVEKITVFSKNPQGVVVVKFTQPGAASEAIKGWDGKSFSLGKDSRERRVRSSFWDGVEDFTIRDETKEEEEMATRHDAFGEWIESHGEEELPEELRLRVEK